MLRPRGIAVVTGLVLISGLCGATLAVADDGFGSTKCQQMPAPVCDLGAGKGGNSGTSGSSPGHDGKPGHQGTGTSGGGNNAGSPGDTITGGKPNLARCSYVKSDYEPPSGVVTAAYHRPLMPAFVTQGAVLIRPVAVARPAGRALTSAGPTPGRSGSWYVWKCTGPGVGTDAVYRPPVWIPDGQEPGATQLPSVAELATMARKQLRLPTPAIAANPAGDQLVNLPTWLWLASGWGPVSATASVPGVSVTAVATPTSVTWSMGDGSTVTCIGAGTPFRPGTDPIASSPDCGHTYRMSSASQMGQAFPVTATVHWTVTWSGAGQSGTFPDMTATGNAAFRVAEAQALNNGGG
jgi:hypothetical protein